MKYYTPQRIYNAFDTVCGGCGKRLRPGRSIIWFWDMPAYRSYHIGCADQFIKPKKKYYPQWIKDKYRKRAIDKRQMVLDFNRVIIK